MARYIATTLVANGYAKECTIHLAYAIGHDQPLSVHVNTHGTGSQHPDTRLALTVRAVFDLSPNGIIKELGLKQPIYSPTAINGHFGNLDFPWEKVSSEKANRLREYFETGYGTELRNKEWKKLLAASSLDKLIENFNREVRVPASSSARFEYIILLVDEIKNRGIDISCITGENNSIRLSKKVKIVNNTLVYSEENNL
jgi:hypothetical protein